ncbi:hypothetical protein NEOLEDRAFT_717549 [Neolentinus lepideus HHB14362 ss-1]|uniref:ferric-chelate reductase (NADPH) n=1 Tax=Neolentinus lepideus HHB14362 ss-1 TaxID=1314782 RepID=A0A165Q580_9AGAM|nr:hypothetical protein NEOLEDRAFT_717549 [Neolentinus lepideus HHB14362 ss-1]
MKDASQLSDDQLSYNLNYPYQTWYTWAAIIGLATLANAVSRLTAFLSRYSPKHLQSNKNILCMWRLPTALANAWRVVAYRSTVHFGWGYSMNVLELFLTAAYFGALFAWSWAHTSHAELGALPYGADFIANRLGTIATSQFPLVTVLGTKNNVISFLTGISHDKLNYLHRMTARVAFVILWMHAGRWMPRAMLPETYYHQAWMQCGVLGLVAFTILCFASIRPAREKAYEWFLWGHFALVFIFLVGAYFHVKRCLYEPWVIACFAVWAFDRLVRVLRVLYFFASSRRPHLHPSKARVERLTPHHLSVRVRRPRGVHWAPGQMVYLMAPGVSALPWEAHPFSVASVDESRYDMLRETGERESGESGEKDGEVEDEMVFIVGVMRGFTARLGRRVEGSERGRDVTVLVDGPYGDAEDVTGYDTVVLIAGGTGVAWTLPILVDTVRYAPRLTRVCGGRSTLTSHRAPGRRAGARYRKCRKVVFIWAIRDRDHVSWIASALGRLFPHISALADMEVSIRIFVTRDRNKNFSTPNVLDDQPPLTPDSIDSKSLEDGGVDAPCVEVRSGRPDVAECVRAEIAMASGGESVFVGVCGSASLAEAVRVGARVDPLCVLRGGPSVVLKVESFGYA